MSGEFLRDFGKFWEKARFPQVFRMCFNMAQLGAMIGCFLKRLMDLVPKRAHLYIGQYAPLRPLPVNGLRTGYSTGYFYSKRGG